MAIETERERKRERERERKPVWARELPQLEKEFLAGWKAGSSAAPSASFLYIGHILVPVLFFFFFFSFFFFAFFFFFFWNSF